MIFVLGAGLIAMLFVHELGHLLVARYYGIRVLSLSVGFGPTLMNFTDRLGTRWRLAAFPLGGGCILNDDLQSRNAAGRQAKNELLPQILRQRALIYAAGPLSNLLLAAAYSLVAPVICNDCALYGNEIGSMGTMSLRLIAELSVAIAAFNLLPFLPLDGGRLCMTAIQAGLGRPISPAGEKRYLVLSVISLTGLTIASLILAFLSLLRHGTSW